MPGRRCRRRPICIKLFTTELLPWSWLLTVARRGFVSSVSMVGSALPLSPYAWTALPPASDLYKIIHHGTASLVLVAHRCPEGIRVVRVNGGIRVAVVTVCLDGVAAGVRSV